MNRAITQLKAKINSWYADHFPETEDLLVQAALGATVLIVGSRKRNGNQLSLILWQSRLLKREGFKRTYVGDDLVYVNDLGMALAVFKRLPTIDIIAETERRDHLIDVATEHGWSVLNIISGNLLANPAKLKASVLQFI